MATTESRKRKREVDPPRVTFITPDRTFERLLKESSLGALHSTVVKKLGLGARASLEFSQIRGAKSIDLEDEDDFEAFESYAASNGVAEVRVKIPDASSSRGRGSDSHVVPPASLPGPEPSSLETSQVTPSLGIMSPVSQANGALGLNNTTVASRDRDSREGSKQKEAQTHETAPSVVAVSSKRETSASKRKTRTRLSKPEHASEVRLNVGQVEKASSVVPQPDAASQESSPSNLVKEQGPAAATKSSGRSEKTSKEKKSKGKVSQAGPAVESVAVPPTTALPSNPSVLTPPTTLVRATSASAPAVPLHEIKQKRSKKQKAPELSGLADDASSRHEQSKEEPPAIPSSTKDKHEGRSEEGHPEKSKSDSVPAQGNQKSRKRRLESEGKGNTDATAPSKSNKSKKRKTDDGSASSATAVHPDNGPYPIAGTTSAPVPPKSSKARKKKPTPEEISQYDADLDNAIANILAKRVSASSRQTASNAPVTTPASSLPDTDKGKELGKEHPVEVGVEDASISKPEKRKKSKQKDAEVLLAPRTDGAEQVPHQRPTENKSIGDANKELGRADQQTVQRQPSRHPSLETVGILEASRKVASSVQRVAQKTSRQTDAATDKLSNATAGDEHVNPSVYSPPGKSTPNAVKRREITTKDSSVLTSPNFERARTAGIQSFAPSGSAVSEIIAQRKEESSSSESDSISVFSDSDNDDRQISVTTPAIQKPQKDKHAHDNTATFFAPDSSFPTGDLNSLDIDALLHPRSTQSWRDVLSSSKDDNNDKEEQLMSDVDEDEDEERGDRPRRGALSKRRPSSTSLDDDDESTSQSASGAASAFEVDSKVDTSYSVPRESTTALNELNLHTSTRTSRASSGQPREVDAQETISTKSVATLTSQDRDNLHSNLQLPSLQDVDARGESVATEGMADLAVNQAMEEDDTFFLAGLDKSTFTKHSRSSEQQLEHHDVSPSLDPHMETLGGRHFTSEISKKCEERNPSPVPPPSSSRLTKSTSQPTSSGPSSDRSKLSSQAGVPGQETTSVTEGSRTGTAGTIDRMRGRNGRKAKPKQSSLAPSSQPPLDDSRAPSSAIPSNTPEVSRSFATSTPTGEQHKRDTGTSFESATSEKRIGSQPAGLLPFQPARQRRNVASTVTRTEEGKSTAKGEDNFPAESEVTSLLFARTETREPSQSAENKKVKPSITETKSYKCSASESTSLKNPEVQEMPKSPSPSPDQTVATGRNVSDINSGSSTEVEWSVNGDKIIADDLIPLPSTQPRRSGSPEQRVPSAASETEDSSSDDDDGRPLMAQMLSNNNSQASLAADRSLTNIANRRDLFSRTSTPRPSLALTQAKTLDSQTAIVEGNDKNDDDDDDDDSSSSLDSSSDDGHVSHIPEERRAGHAASQIKSSQGLKSFFSFFA